MPPPRQLTWVEFADQECAFYVAMGMTPDEFWNGDYSMLKFYRSGYEVKREIDNEKAWLQGLYFYDALCAALSPKEVKYTEEPYILNTRISESRMKEKERKEVENFRTYMETMAANINAKFSQKAKGVNEHG